MADHSKRRDPHGIAHWDYSSPCPGCHLPVKQGDPVHKISLPNKKSEWWHTDCRTRYRKTLIYGGES